MKKLFVLFTTVALGVTFAATAAKYHVTISQPSVVNGTELKAGDYKVEVEGDKATFKLGKTTVETPVKVQEAPQKNFTNEIRYEGDKVQEIRIGGTHTRLVFSGPPAEVHGTR
jgi:hypothetical protein